MTACSECATLRVALEISERCAKEQLETVDENEALVEKNIALEKELAQLKADHELAVTSLATARNDLLRALPGEDERQVLRWIRELLRQTTTAHNNIRYPAALELVQRLLTMKVNHAA